jgi:LysM repeat protein
MKYAVVIGVWLFASAASANARTHVVRPGDSLSGLAERYRVRVEELRAWNRIRGDVIRVGQELAVEQARAEHYRVRPGDTTSCVALRFGVPVARLRADNPALVTRGLEAGMALLLPPGTTARAERAASGTSRSESVGSATCGAIAGHVQLGAHPGYVLRDPSRAYATQRTLDRIRAAFDAVRRADPRGPRVRVHDLSLRGGGPIDDHRSHQSGRDVDVTYYQRRGCGPDGCPLRAVGPTDLDARRTWRLLRHWLVRGQASAIYVDDSLQESLLREARRTGATRAQLDAWFQFPRGRTDERGVIRHFPNHLDHFHVRFACHASEPRCE